MKNTETQPVEILKDEAVLMPVDNDETITDEMIDHHHEEWEVDPGTGVVNDETEIGPEVQATKRLIKVMIKTVISRKRL